MLAAAAAKNINAPDSVIFFETGAVDSLLEELPLAVGHPRIMYWSAANAGLLEAFATMQNRHTGDKVIAAFSAAQIDIYGNLNTTCIGDYLKPDIRFAGSGGSCDVASFVPRCIAFMQHEKRKFGRPGRSCTTCITIFITPHEKTGKTGTFVHNVHNDFYNTSATAQVCRNLYLYASAPFESHPGD